MQGVSTIDALCSADKAGALLNYEAAAKLEAFRGRLDEARRLFREGSASSRPSSRYLREWGAFEKRAGSLDVSTPPMVQGILRDADSRAVCKTMSSCRKTKSLLVVAN